MNTIVISAQEVGKDIESKSKKNQKIEVGKGDDLFGTLISNLLKEENPDNSSNFLINKILDKGSSFEQKEKLVSDFSKGSLEESHEIGHISIQELLEIAIRLKKGEELPNFPTDSKPLKAALSSPKIISEFKSAKNIHDLLFIAEKNGIKVKNFQFFKEEAPLLSQDKKILSNITSEEIFKLIDKKVPKEKLTEALIEKKIEPKKESSLLQNFLFGKSETKKGIKSEIDSSFSHERSKDVKKVVNKAIKTTDQKLDIKEQPKAAHKAIKNIDQKLDIKEQPKAIYETIKTIDQKLDIKEQPKAIHETIKTIDQKLDIKEQPKAIHETIKNIDQKLDIKEQPKATHEAIKTIDQKLDIKEQPKAITTNHVEQKTEKREQPKNIQTINEIIKAVDVKDKSQNSQIPHIQKNENSVIKTLNQQIKTIQANLSTKEQKQKIDKDMPAKSNINNIKNELLQKIQHSQILSKNIVSEVQTKQNIELLNMKSSVTNRTITEESKKLDITQENKVDEKSLLLHEVKGEKIEKTKFTQDIKRTFNTFAQDFKEQVDNYKAPLMKIKMQLSPKNMGDVDVTLLNRGNNLHVNIQANSNTLSMFLQHHAEFKNSLINMGFSGLQMNFGEHNKDRQNEQQKRGTSKNSFESDERESKEIEDINLVIPRYI